MAIASPKTKEELVRQFKFNPEVDTRLEAFMKAEPGLVQFVKELPREQLERKFLLRKMRDQQQKHGYDAKVKAWLEKPEQAELVKSLKATISPHDEARNNRPRRSSIRPRTTSATRASKSADADGTSENVPRLISYSTQTS